LEINLTGIEEKEMNSPSSLNIYPNPVHAAATIYFDLPTDGQVKLVLFDFSGQERVQLLNERKPTGNYTVNFDASTIPSGIYLCTLTAGGRSTSKKIMIR